MHRAPLVSLDLQEKLDHRAHLAQLENRGHRDFRGKKAPLAFVVIMDLLENRGSVDLPDPREAPETRETLERMVQRVLMVLLVQLELQDREALWVFLVREENVGCRVFQDQRVRQESRAPQEHRETKAPQVLLVFLVPTDPVAIPVLMVPQDPTDRREKTAFPGRGETEEMLVRRV